MIDKNKPVLGTDIRWKDIKGETFRVTHFLFIATMENGKIKTDSLTDPYAVLSVESPGLKEESEIAVVNRTDFYNLWKAVKERAIDPNEEVLVVYRPVFRAKLFKFLAAPMAKLHVYIFPAGHLEEMYDKNFKPADADKWKEPLAKFSPDV